MSSWAIDVPELKSNTTLAKAGFYKLSWQKDLGDIEIEEAANSQFSSVGKLYPGSDTAVIISGKPDGDWFYRARRINDKSAGDWSQIVQVTVKHHSLPRSLAFFMTGLIMFIATCWLVIRGERLA